MNTKCFLFLLAGLFIDVEIKMKENLGGELEASYLSLRGFTGKKCRRSIYGQGYFLECVGKREQKVSVLLGKAL